MASNKSLSYMVRSGLFVVIVSLHALILDASVCVAGSGTVSVFGWGRNQFGETTVPAAATNVVSVCGGDTHSVALRADGRVVIWGDDSLGQVTGIVHTDGQPHYQAVAMPPEMTNVIKIAACANTTAALRGDGTLVTWGYRNDYLQTNAPLDLQKVMDVAIGGSTAPYVFMVAVEQGGRAVGWGNNDNGQCNFPQNLGKVVGVAAGNNHTVLLLGNGTVAAFGSDAYSARDVPANLRNVVSVGAGNGYSVALCEDGSLVDWGNSQGWPRPPALTNVVSFACGMNNFLVLFGNGNVAGVGYSTGYGELTIPNGVSGVLGVGIGGQHSLVMLAPAAADIAALLQISTYPGFVVSGTPGAAYRIEYATDLGAGAVWNLLTNITLFRGEQRFTDWTAPAQSRRFYRAVLP